MASPSASSVETQWKNAVAIGENLLDSQTVESDQDDYTQSLESDFATQQVESVSTLRADVSRALGAMGSVQDAVLRAYAKHVVNRPANDAQTALDRMFPYFVANSKTLKSRGITFGALSAGGSNVGNGTIRRLTLDRHGYVREAVTAEPKQFKCTNDQSTGTQRNQELFEIAGANNDDADELNRNRSGLVTQLSTRTATNSLLANPSFSQFAIAGTVAIGTPYTLQTGDSVTGWTITTIGAAQLTRETADQYRTNAGDTNPTALRFSANNAITQALSVNNIVLSPETPYDLLIPIKREDSADGTLTVTIGATSQNFAVTGLAAGWNAVFLTLGAGLWAEVIATNNAAVTVTLASRTTGSIVIDDITLVPFVEIDGSHYVIHAGTTPWREGDIFTSSVTISSDSVLQKWLWRSFGRYLPHVGVATEVTASGGRTLTFAASGKTITASTGSFITDGFEPTAKLVVAGTSDNNGTFTIVSVTATVITVVETVVDEGPLSATATLNAGPSITDPA